MDQIAPFIIKRLPAQPDLLGEACRVMSIAPADFIVITLPRTLPSVFADCDRRVLDSMTQELSTKASSLFIKHSHNILAYIFRLPDQPSTTKALNFVIQILTEATTSSIDVRSVATTSSIGVQTPITNSSIDILSVVKSCLVPMLAELVVVMGDERPEIAQQVWFEKLDLFETYNGLVAQGIVALNRVKNIVVSNKKGGPLTTNLGTFLKTYMLGLISEVNEMLQDVQGKKTVSIKRKILRSLGALVEHADIAINNVAPQVLSQRLSNSDLLIVLPDYGDFSNHGQHTGALRGYPRKLVQVSNDVGNHRTWTSRWTDQCCNRSIMDNFLRARSDCRVSGPGLHRWRVGSRTWTAFRRNR
jgi:serine/threonine-protein kinase ATR